MSSRIFTPVNFEQAPLGLVLFNHGGSTVAQDTGRNAQELFEALDQRLPVLAIDRPGTDVADASTQVALRLSRTAGYLDALKPQVTAIETFAGELGLGGIVVLGHSAAGQAALGAAIQLDSGNNGLKRVAVGVSEPTALECHSPLTAWKRHKEYEVRQSALLDDPSLGKLYVQPTVRDLSPEVSHAREKAIQHDFEIDARNNGLSWNSAISMHFLSRLVNKHRRVGVHIALAKESKTAVRASTIQKLRAFVDLNAQHGADAPFELVERHFYTHASFDNQAAFLQEMKPLITWTEHNSSA